MSTVDLLRAVAALIWPFVVAAVLVALLPVVRGLIKKSQSFEIEVAGTKISVQTATDTTRKQIEDLQDRVNAIEATSHVGTRADETPTGLPRPRKILWVDDLPDGNVYERARVMDVGYDVVQADSTVTALQMVDSDGPFEVIVSDMSRVETGGSYNSRAGLDLVRALRQRADITRVVFYSSRRSLAPVMNDLHQIPNVAWTTSPSELMYHLGISGTAS